MTGIVEQAPAHGDVRPSVSAVINDLKNAFRTAFASDIETGRIRSVFLIGSKSIAEPPYAAGDTSRITGFYQDFDVHFLLGRGSLEPDELIALRDRVDGICDEFASPQISVGWGVRDRHWKLVPEPDKPLNICVHVVICNKFDYQCRALYQPVLGSNMYRICELLVGEHPGEMLPALKPSGAELLYSAGGVGWMLEQFHRALLLHWWEPDDQDFMPYLSGYSWNVASSIMLELYSVFTDEVITRRGALYWLLQRPDLPAVVAESVRMLDEYKEVPQVDPPRDRQLVNAAFIASHWMTERIHERIGMPLAKVPKGGAIRERDLHSDAVSAVLGRPVEISEAHLGFEPGDDPMASLEALAEKAKERYVNPNACELPEFLAWFLYGGHNAATKLTIWSSYSMMRYLLSEDFAYAHGRPSLWAALWGWESGAQGLLQRLHERYMDRHTLIRNRRPTQGTEIECQIARSFAGIAGRQMCMLGLNVGKPASDALFDQADYLARMMEASSVWPANVG